MGVGVLAACVWQALARQGAVEHGAEVQGVRSAAPVVALDMQVILLRYGFQVEAAFLTGLLWCFGTAHDTFGRVGVRTGVLGVGGVCSQIQAASSVRHDTGTGNTVIMWSRVPSGTGTGSGSPYPSNTIPISTVLRVCRYRHSGQVSDHLTLLIR